MWFYLEKRMFEKYYFIFVLGLCMTAAFQWFTPKEETYSFAASIPTSQYEYNYDSYFNNSGYKEEKNSKKESNEITAVYGNIYEKNDYSSHFRPFIP